MLLDAFDVTHCVVPLLTTRYTIFVFAVPVINAPVHVPPSVADLQVLLVVDDPTAIYVLLKKSISYTTGVVPAIKLVVNVIPSVVEYSVDPCPINNILFTTLK